MEDLISSYLRRAREASNPAEKDAFTARAQELIASDINQLYQNEKMQQKRLSPAPDFIGGAS